MILLSAIVIKALGCENTPPELFQACELESLAIVNPSTGFVITDENCGLEIDKETFYEQPYVFYTDALSYKKYTLVMMDRDNSEAEEGDSFLHWMVTDIEGESLRYGLGINVGNTVAGKLNPIRSRLLNDDILTAYFPPSPSQTSCVHRYTFYLYEQTFFHLQFPELPATRLEFDPFTFIENVTPIGGICGPVASVEFKTRY